MERAGRRRAAADGVIAAGPGSVPIFARIAAGRLAGGRRDWSMISNLRVRGWRRRHNLARRHSKVVTRRSSGYVAGVPDMGGCRDCQLNMGGDDVDELAGALGGDPDDALFVLDVRQVRELLALGRGHAPSDRSSST